MAEPKLKLMNFVSASQVTLLTFSFAFRFYLFFYSLYYTFRGSYLHHHHHHRRHHFFTFLLRLADGC